MAMPITKLSIRGVTRRVNHYHGCGGGPISPFDIEPSLKSPRTPSSGPATSVKRVPMGQPARMETERSLPAIRA
jgi:hypothetical protein